MGILVGPDTDADQLTTLISRIDAEDMVPLVIAPQGGEVAPGVVAHRTLLTARSIEFDAVVVTTAGAPAHQVAAGMDAKAGAPSPGDVDPRVSLLLNEMWRHAKAIAAFGPGVIALETLQIGQTPGVVGAESAEDALDSAVQLLGSHRVWERFPTTGMLA